MLKLKSVASYAIAIISIPVALLWVVNRVRKVGVFMKYRKKGIGNILMEVAEDIAKKYADTVIIGVGLHRDYGQAQRMYVKRGFIFDGSGIWWKGKPLEPYADFKNDDEENACYSKFDTVACVSRTALDSLKTLYPTLHNLKIVYNPIDESLIRKMASAHSVDRKAGRINMITIGRLVQQKGYDRLIPILGELKKQGLQFFLRILGTGTQEQLLKELISKYGLTHYIELTGFKENPYPYLAASDLFVCSSRSEGYSTAVTEALILGLPVVTTECSGMKELLGNNNEWGLVVPNDDLSLQRALQAVISNPNTLQDLKNKAMARSHDFSLKKLMTAIEDTLLG